MATSHNHGPSIFNVDALGGIPAALREMLVVSRRGGIRILPAVASALLSRSVRGVRCRGGICIHSLERDLRDTAVGEASVRISSLQAREVSISAALYGRSLGIELVDGAGEQALLGSTLRLSLQSGMQRVVRLRW